MRRLVGFVGWLLVARSSPARPLAVTLGRADRERCALACAVARISKSVNQPANVCGCPGACRWVKKIAGVSVDDESPLSDEQMESERWTKDDSAAEAVDGYLAVLNGAR
jgi:hypothetical protein